MLRRWGECNRKKQLPAFTFWYALYAIWFFPLIKSTAVVGMRQRKWTLAYQQHGAKLQPVRPLLVCSKGNERWRTDNMDKTKRTSLFKTLRCNFTTQIWYKGLNLLHGININSIISVGKHTKIINTCNIKFCRGVIVIFWQSTQTCFHWIVMNIFKFLVKHFRRTQFYWKWITFPKLISSVFLLLL